MVINMKTRAIIFLAVVIAALLATCAPTTSALEGSLAVDLAGASFSPKRAPSPDVATAAAGWPALPTTGMFCPCSNGAVTRRRESFVDWRVTWA